MSDTFNMASCPVSVVIKRIKRAIAVGCPLEGMKFFESFQTRSEKSDDLPRCYIVDYSDKENHSGGAPSIEPFVGINSVISQTATLGIQLVVDSRNGWLTAYDEENVRKMGIINIKNLLLDQLETDDDGELDASLDNALDKPIMFATRESGIFDLGIVMDITVTLTGPRMNRATRSSLITSDPP